MAYGAAVAAASSAVLSRAEPTPSGVGVGRGGKAS